MCSVKSVVINAYKTFLMKGPTVSTKLQNGWRKRIRYHVLFLTYIIFLIVLTLSPFEFSSFWLEKLLDVVFIL